MPFPAAHSYVTFLGDAYQQREIWQTGLRLAGTAVPTEAQLQALADAFSDNIWPTSTFPPSTHRFLGVKWAPIQTNGLYPPDAVSLEHFLEAPIPGTAGTGYPQIAIVLSLRTTRARGYASNGRMYIPSALPIGSGGQIPEADAINVSLAAAQFISDVDAVGLGQPVVMSKVGAGVTAPITGVRVGRVMDTQRRRRNAIPEEYTAAAPVPS